MGSMVLTWGWGCPWHLVGSVRDVPPGPVQSPSRWPADSSTQPDVPVASGSPRPTVLCCLFVLSDGCPLSTSLVSSVPSIRAQSTASRQCSPFSWPALCLCPAICAMSSRAHQSEAPKETERFLFVSLSHLLWTWHRALCRQRSWVDCQQSRQFVWL